MGLFTLRGELSARANIVLSITGAISAVVVWYLAIFIWDIKPQIFPTPHSVFQSFPELHYDDFLIQNAIFSIKLNVLGYLEAVAIAIPLGFLIGLFPFFRGLLLGWVKSARFLPITALVGLFILWFGMYTNMKVQFLTLGILVYLIPVIVQRVDDLDEVYDNCVITLGATKWQRIKTVFIPGVMGKVFDDIRVIIAISWTYIIIAEVVNMEQGGIGALAYRASREFRPDKVFAALVVIMLIGFVQDKILIQVDKLIFKYKYAKGGR